jgi:hypothetical protein
MEWLQALRDITPASDRNSIAHAAPLPPHLVPLLSKQLSEALDLLSEIFPPLLLSSSEVLFLSVFFPFPLSSSTVSEASDILFQREVSTVHEQWRRTGASTALVHRPRFLIAAEGPGMGQTQVL